MKAEKKYSKEKGGVRRLRAGQGGNRLNFESLRIQTLMMTPEGEVLDNDR
jgi:hypothetical protein